MLLGHIDLIDRHTIRGWAADTDRPDTAIDVAVFLNGRLVGLARADQPRDEAQDSAALGSGLHGIAFVFNPPLATDQDHEIAVRFVEGGRLLAQWRVAREAATPAQVDEIGTADAVAHQDREARAAAPKLVGFVDECTRSGVKGWAASEANPNEVIEIEVSVDDRTVARIACDVPRADLAKSGRHGNGAHGFAYRFDPPLPLDRAAYIKVTFVDSDLSLKGGYVRLLGLADRPKTVSPSMADGTDNETTAALVGYIDAVDRCMISGWAADTSAPDEPVEVLIFVNGEPVTSVLANDPRPDLAAEGGFGKGLHGFHYYFDTPLSLLNRYEIVTEFVATRETLNDGRVFLEKQHSLVRGSAPAPQFGLEPKDDLSPVLVTSTGRSGTTLLMRRLANASEVVIAEQAPFEVKLLTYYAHAFDVLTAPGNREKSVVPELIFDDPYHLGLNPFHHHYFTRVFADPEGLYDFFGKQVPPIVAAAFKNIIGQFYGRLADVQSKSKRKYFAEKCDVFNTARDFARALFSGTREIMLVRDPRDVFCSQRKFFAANADAAFQGLRSVRDRALEFNAEQAPHMLYVRYEDLVRQPEPTLARIATLLGLKEPITIDTSAEAQQFGYHGTSRDPEASIGRWQRELTAEERRRFDEELGSYLDLFGYERATPAPVGRADDEPPSAADGVSFAEPSSGEPEPSADGGTDIDTDLEKSIEETTTPSPTGT